MFFDMNFKDYTNEELVFKEMVMKNEYESLSNEIEKKIEQLESLEGEINSINNEINLRRKI